MQVTSGQHIDKCIIQENKEVLFDISPHTPGSKS